MYMDSVWLASYIAVPIFTFRTFSNWLASGAPLTMLSNPL